MSGRGRNNYGGRGNYRSGRGSGRGTGRFGYRGGNKNKSGTSTGKNDMEMKFAPHYPGKP